MYIWLAVHAAQNYAMLVAQSIKLLNDENGWR